MIDPAPNHLHIYRDRRGKHITLDGHELLLDGEDPLLITGVENQEEITRVMLTLLAPKITIDPETEDQEPETATVDAPAPTIAEGLRDLARTLANLAINSGIEDLTSEELNRLIDRAEQIEQERDYWKNYALDRQRQVERLTTERDAATVAREENVAADQQANTQGTLSGSLPDPADVPAGEAWQVLIDDIEPTVGFSANGAGWVCYRCTHGTALPIEDERITIVSRLVPAPRQITTREELNALPEGTVIRARGELVCERYRHRSKGLVWISTGVDEDFPVERPVLPATVLWAPEVAA